MDVSSGNLPAPPAIQWIRAASRGQNLDLELCARQYVQWIIATFPSVQHRAVAASMMCQQVTSVSGVNMVPALALTIALMGHGANLPPCKLGDDPVIKQVQKAPNSSRCALDILSQAGFVKTSTSGAWSTVPISRPCGCGLVARLTPDGVLRIPSSDRAWYAVPSTSVTENGYPVASVILEVALDPVTKTATSGTVFFGVAASVVFPESDVPCVAMVVSPFTRTEKTFPRTASWSGLIESGWGWRLLVAHQYLQAQEKTLPSIFEVVTNPAHVAVRARIVAEVRNHLKNTTASIKARGDLSTRRCNPPNAKRQRSNTPKPSAVVSEQPPTSIVHKSASTALATTATYHLLSAMQTQACATEDFVQCTPLIDQLCMYLAAKND
jgi:hypothetical protein